MLTVGGTRFGLYPARGGETADALLVQLLDRGVLFVGDAFTPYLGAAICARHSVYARSELPEPSHQVETPLLPSAKYFWTVRARFHARRGHPGNTLGPDPWERLQRCRRAESLLLRFEDPGEVTEVLL
jgi:hypothetical protein